MDRVGPQSSTVDSWSDFSFQPLPLGCPILLVDGDVATEKSSECLKHELVESQMRAGGWMTRCTVSSRRLRRSGGDSHARDGLEWCFERSPSYAMNLATHQCFSAGFQPSLIWPKISASHMVARTSGTRITMGATGVSDPDLGSSDRICMADC